MDKVSLTASMRSNLLSLQNISRQVDVTQNRLSSGKKVNSAIDNPSSYYTARSLSNRASDLDALLDSMGQAVSTIKVATTALETAAGFLEQASAVATQALEEAQPVIARVSTEEELLAAVNSGKEGLIVLNNDITMSENQNIELKDGQSLVGSRYLDGSGPQYKLTFNLNGEAQAAIIAGNASLISDINIEVAGNAGKTAVLINDKEGIRLNNLNIVMSDKVASKTAISATTSSYVISGNLNIKITDNSSMAGASYGIANNHAVLDVEENAVINIKGMQNSNCRALYNIGYSTTTINNNAKLNIDTHGISAFGIENYVSSELYVKSGAEININSGTTLCIINNNYENSGNNLIYFESGSKVNLTTTMSHSIQNLSIAGKENVIFWEQGAEISTSSADGSGSYVTTDEFKTSDGTWSGWTFDRQNEFNKISSTPTAPLVIDIDAEMAKEKEVIRFEQFDSGQYTGIVSQYDSLIKDSSYKGVNLLQEQDLKVTFNESRSAWLDVKGKDASSTALGLTTTEWNTIEDIAQSLKEISSALNQIRSMSAELGSYYNIVLNRQDFTENLINVLEEGADKLTLADMNEESANMLALERQHAGLTNPTTTGNQFSLARLPSRPIYFEAILVTLLVY